MAQRRLAAIMFSDIVGYDSLLKEDEKKAFEILRKNQRIHKRLIRKFNGRWLKEMESGTLASFSSIIDAVMCVVLIQKATEEIKIPIRIGIHQGDVIFEKKDVLGDGVNIASRIHSLIDTPGIVISDTVYKDIKNKEGLEIESLGTHTLKGIDAPVGIYKVSCIDENVLDFAIDTGELIRPLSFERTTIVFGILVIALLAFALYYFLPKIINPPSEQDQSILVLPCVNYLGTDTLDYYLAGMHDAMIGDIGKIGALRVISTTTAKTYKNTEKSIPEIASELGVNNIVEPSVMCLGDSVCIRLKAISAYPEEKQLWVRDFKVGKSEILNLYNMVTKEISKEMGTILTPEQERRLAEARTVDDEAYKAYLRGMYHLSMEIPEDNDKGLAYLHKAVEIDPDEPFAYAGLARGYLEIAHSALASGDELIKAEEAANQAIKLDTSLAEVYAVMAEIYLYDRWEWEKAEKYFIKALELDPNMALTHWHYAWTLYLLGRTEEAIIEHELAQKIDPFHPGITAQLGLLYCWVGRYEDALREAQKLLEIIKDYQRGYLTLGRIYLVMGRTEDAIEAHKKHVELNPRGKWALGFTYAKSGYRDEAEKILNELEKSEVSQIDALNLIRLNDALGKMDEAFKWLAYEPHHIILPWVAVSPLISKQFREDPRFEDFLKRLNLPN
jgi:tetratricopeptide (TPR) repeat protein